MVMSLSLLLALSGAAVAQQQQPASQHPNTQNPNAQHPSTSSSTNRQGDRAKSDTSGMVNASDRKFLEEAAKGGAMEVALGQLALQKASDPKVKAFAQRMVDDHSKANQDLEQVASRKSLTLPSNTPNPPSHLSNLSGAQFDHAYVDLMVKDHQKDVAEFQKMSRNAHDPEVKEFATRTLSTLQDHLKEIQSIKSSR